MSQSGCQSHWRAFGLKPHLRETFKLSPDPFFIEKVRDVVGLISIRPRPPWCCASTRRPRCRRSIAPLRCHRSVQDSPSGPPTTTCETHHQLYAALDMASGKVIADMTDRHRAVEFRKFLNPDQPLGAEDLDVHLIIDQTSRPTRPRDHRWLLRHPRFHLHFTPTYSSWMNMVERWFAELTEKWLRRGTHHSTKELKESITYWIDQ